MSDFNNVRCQKKPVSNREYFLNIDESKIKNFEERTFIQNYKQKYNQTSEQLEAAEEKLSVLQDEIFRLNSSKKTNEVVEKLRVLNDDRIRIRNKIHHLNSQLATLERDEMFIYLVEQEKEKESMAYMEQVPFRAWMENDIKKRQEWFNRNTNTHTQSQNQKAEQRNDEEIRQNNSKYTKEILFAICTCLALALLFFIGIADLSIGYYTFLRIITIIGLPTCILLNCIEAETILNPVTFVSVPIAILFNPLAPIYLDKSTWAVLDIICGIAMIALAIFMSISYVRKHKNK